MKFEELYEKYVAGECTPEEKTFVEEEMEKAIRVNDVIMSGRKAELKPAEDEKVKKVKKKFGFKMLFTAAIVTVAVLLVATGAVLGGVFGTAASAAKKGDTYGMGAAQNKAIDIAYAYLVDNNYYSGSKEALIVADRDKDFNIVTPLKKSSYIYSFEVKWNNVEIEIEINGSTGEYRITDVDVDSHKNTIVGSGTGIVGTGNANKNYPLEQPVYTVAEAEAPAIDCAYEYLTEHNFSGAKSELRVTDRDTDIKTMLASQKRIYIYEFEIKVGLYEVEVEVNGSTGECRVVDFDYN